MGFNSAFKVLNMRLGGHQSISPLRKSNHDLPVSVLQILFFVLVTIFQLDNWYFFLHTCLYMDRSIPRETGLWSAYANISDDFMRSSQSRSWRRSSKIPTGISSSRDNVIGTSPSNWLDRSRFEFCSGKRLTIFPNHPNRLWGHTSPPVRWVPLWFPEGKENRDVKLTTYPCLVPRMDGTVLVIRLYAFLECTGTTPLFFWLESAGSGRTQWLSRANTIHWTFRLYQRPPIFWLV